MDNDYGIYLCDTESNTIYGNIIEENAIGIFAIPSVIPVSCDDLSQKLVVGNDICGNTIYNNNAGILLTIAYNNNVFENNITNNDEGIYMEGLYGWGGNNNIYRNNIMNNKNGIYITRLNGGMKNNKIYQNNFIGNINQANDHYADNNKWDNGSVGNYWDDYIGWDLDRDGIGDIPYRISLFVKDNFPLMGPWPDVHNVNLVNRNSHKNQQSSNPLLIKLLEQFPLLERLLNLL